MTRMNEGETLNEGPGLVSLLHKRTFLQNGFTRKAQPFSESPIIIYGLDRHS
jgi:hypothetical protein